MDTGAWVIIGGVTACFVILMTLNCYVTNRAAQQRRSLLRMRPVQSLSKWYERGYMSAGVRFCSALLIAERLARCLNCHVTQILETDRFDNELAIKAISFFPLDEDDEMAAFESEMFDLLDGSFECLPLDTVETVGDLIRICDGYIHRERPME